MNVFEKYLTYGLSVIPCRDKIPLGEWKQYQNKPATTEAALWSGDIAVVCGKISGGLVCIDFDVKNGDRWSQWQTLISQQAPEILSKLVVEQTPSGGYHVIFRSEKETRNIKLAKNIDNKAMIETRGEGGYFVCAPSKNYSFCYSDFSQIQKLTNDETETIISIAKSFNELTIEKQEAPTQKEKQSGLTPFDDFNSRADVAGLLSSRGWKILFQKGDVVYYQRPGKEGRGISATWNAIPNRFYVFSTSTPFENEHIYKASAVYAILEHGGDWSVAAKALFASGYGKTETPQAKAVLINNSNIKKNMLAIKAGGYKTGESTGWGTLDEYYTIIKGQFTVITGMPSHGKSQVIDAIMVNLATNKQWKFAVFSPENYPVEMHYHQLIEKKTGGKFWELSNEDISDAVDFIGEHFYFIDALEEEINLDAILLQTQELIETKHIDGLVLDPWNEIELSKPKDLSTTEYIGVCLRKCRKFARRNHIHLWIVAHPIKMMKDKNGAYPIPELYDIEGSAHWRNKADNGLCVFRDFANDITQIHIQKIKYRYTGKPGCCFLKYNSINGRYDNTNETPETTQFGRDN